MDGNCFDRMRTLWAVESSDLTREQAEILRQHIGDALAYVGRLRRRMEQRQFPHKDPLYLATVETFNSLQHLHITAHYLACRSGVGRPAR